ncbi:MAG: hypothetical protein IPN69_11870 [Acidobacteria bacterium]|nr:hypothetical protein [Acidobacteriota bacterium]
MSQDFKGGDFLIFQIESGYGLLRLLAIDSSGAERIWHLRGYAELFPDIESAEAALENPERFTISLAHAALTNRAFEATQTARLKNEALADSELEALKDWKSRGSVASDRSIRLMLGLR